MFTAEFVKMMGENTGERRASAILEALVGEPVVSVRVNPFKISPERLREHFGPVAGEAVPWAADEAFYLTERPSFTLDPLFHAGAYYVQEASSMFVGQLFDTAAGELGEENLNVLDLCAAPGGKTTQILSHLNGRGHLVANEVIGSRVPILAENVAKWGCGNVTVANSDASCFGKSAGGRGGQSYDIIVTDVPCSGEGMFRKGEQAQDNWSVNNVMLCASRQRRIVSDVWPALRDGGFLIYSTCTFNRYEDEDNVEWVCNELGAECLKQRHFYPGEDKGEGFFAALLRKNGDFRSQRDRKQVKPSYRIYESQFPQADEALSVSLDRSRYSVVELSKEDALRFLAKEPLAFEGQPAGLILLTYKDIALGFVKNLGRRSNNLHPSPRRIKKQIPS
ncbi:MAG: hypothetical protein KBS72_01725 [Bacteroidales bacterium]|nr:hypothetical protein [Candidatus Cacconaster scatequi]